MDGARSQNLGWAPFGCGVAGSQLSKGGGRPSAGGGWRSVVEGRLGARRLPVAGARVPNSERRPAAERRSAPLGVHLGRRGCRPRCAWGFRRQRSVCSGASCGSPQASGTDGNVGDGDGMCGPGWPECSALGHSGQAPVAGEQSPRLRAAASPISLASGTREVRRAAPQSLRLRRTLAQRPRNPRLVRSSRCWSG